MYNLNIYIKDKPTKKNPACIILVYVNEGERHLIERNLKHKGINDRLYLSRTCSEDEVQNETKNPYRYEYLKYDNWQKLIDDEKKYNDGEDWIQKLNDLKNKFPQFNK